MIVLGDHHQPGGILVQPVDDAGPLDAADPGQAGAAMRDQRVHQGPGFVPGGGMHHEAGRLVEDDDIVVLVDDVERDRLGLRLGRGRFGHVDCDRVAAGDVISGVAHRPGAEADLAGQDQRLQPGPRQLRQPGREHAIEPRRAFVAGDNDRHQTVGM